MRTVVPPSHNRIATPIAEVATVQDLWRLSDVSGVPPCAIYCAMQQVVGLDSEHICDGD